LKRSLAIWVPPAVWTAVILTLSSLPGVELEYISFDWGDKLAHFAEYGVLGILVSRMFYLRGKGFPSVVTGSLLAGIGLAAIDELHQIPIRNRYCELGDYVSDVLGIGFGLIVYSIWRKVKG
jgi:VanZ family protein